MKKTLLSVVVALACSACGGGGGSSQMAVTAASSASSGKTVDGYLSAASVLCDTNNNGSADTGETIVTTDSVGNFVFPSGCGFPVVATGGTNTDTGLPFLGRLQGPTGSTVVTPLTSLMVSSGLTAAQVATALGLPAGTDVSKVDPVGDLVLQAKTLAVQQIIQQITDTIASLGKNSTPTALQAIYSQVAKAVVTTLVANAATPLIDSSGAIKSTLVSAMVVQSVSNVQTTTDTTLTALTGSAGTLSAISPNSVATLISSAVVAQAQTLSQVTSVAALTTAATALQANPVIAQAATQLATLLTVAAAAKNVDLSTVGSSLTVLSSSDNSAAAVVAKAAVAAAVVNQTAVIAATANIVAPTLAVSTWSQATNNLLIQADSIVFNGTTSALAAFDSASGASFARKAVSIDTVSLGLTVNGTPIPLNANGVMSSTVSLGVELTDTGSGGRVLQMILDRVNLSVNSSKVLSATVPAGAKLYVYGKTSNGTTGNLIVSNITTDQFLSISNNLLTLNAGKVLTRILNDVNAQPTASMQTLFNNLGSITGTFHLKMVLNNVSLASNVAGSVQGLSVTVTGSDQPAVSGLGVSGLITVTP